MGGVEKNVKMVERENTIVASVLETRVGKTSLLQVSFGIFNRLKRFQILPSLCRDFGADKTFVL